MFESIDDLDGGIEPTGIEDTWKSGLRFRPERSGAGDQAATLAPYRIEFFPAGEKVMIHQADHMEAVRYDLRFRKVFLRQRTPDMR